MEDYEKLVQALKDRFGGEVILEIVLNKGRNVLTPWVHQLYYDYYLKGH